MLGQNSLAVGMIREDKLFLTQVSDSYEFKPCLQRLDDLQNSRGQSARSGQKGDEDVNVENEASKVTSVTMRFAGANEEDMKRAREHSYVHHLEKIRSEPAIDLEYVPETSLRAKEIFESLGRLWPYVNLTKSQSYIIFSARSFQIPLPCNECMVKTQLLYNIR